MLTAEAVKALGHESMPKLGLVPITVPGVPAAWAALSRRFGKLSLLETLEPAIRYAEEGYPISPILGKYWKRAYAAYKRQKGKEFESWFNTFSINGRAPEIR
ncbi:Gamma-glutamyltranspeptidase/glutathione hydrolase OS=Ureibacillus acetophenoni OX=614649 GN=SAMN05877842_11519 PE=4 SV=1 [Ureibacillus acetophenoni]